MMKYTVPISMATATAAVVAAALFAATVMVAAAAATTLRGLKLLRSSIAHNPDTAYKTYILAGKRVIEIHNNLLVGNFKYLAGDTVSVMSQHRHYGTGLYMLGIKLAVNLKKLFFKMCHLFGVIIAETLFSRYFYVKLIACRQTVDSLFERSYDTASHSEYNLFGIFSIDLMHQSLAIGIYHI